MKNPIIFFLFILITSCNEGKISSYASAGSISFRGFRLQAPAGWTGEQLQGTDSEVGMFTNGKDTFYYDLGWYNSGYQSLTTGEYTQIDIQVDGRVATVWQPKNPSLHSTFFYVKIDDLNSLSIHGQTSNQKELLAIFQSIKFN